MPKRSEKEMAEEEFERRFDSGEDMSDDADMGTLRRFKDKRPLVARRTINVDFPEWVIDRLDQAAERIGVTRQSVVKTWIVDRIEAEDRERRTPEKSEVRKRA